MIEKIMSINETVNISLNIVRWLLIGHSITVILMQKGMMCVYQNVYISQKSKT